MYNFQPFVAPTTWNQLEEQPWAQAHWQALPPPPSSHPIMHLGWYWPWQTMPGMPWCRTPSPYYFHAGLPFAWTDPPNHWQAECYYPSYWQDECYYPSHWQGMAQHPIPSQLQYRAQESGPGVLQTESQYINQFKHESPGTVSWDRSTGTHRGVGAVDKTGAAGEVWRTPSQRTH
jgi:hypothetical protein